MRWLAVVIVDIVVIFDGRKYWDLTFSVAKSGTTQRLAVDHGTVYLYIRKMVALRLHFNQK